MLNRTIHAVCAVCFSIVVYSQSAQDETRPNNDFGFNTNIILQNVFNSTSAPFSLMYKRYNSETKAWRYGLTTSFTSYKPLDISNSAATSTFSTTVNVSVSIGREIQKVISNKWIWFLGGDLVPSYSSNNTDQYDMDTKTNNTLTINYGIAARPFVGLRFNVTRQLYLSTEFSVNLSYAHLSTRQENFPSGTVSNRSLAQYSLAFNPASSIFIFYRF